MIDERLQSYEISDLQPVLTLTIISVPMISYQNLGSWQPVCIYNSYRILEFCDHHLTSKVNGDHQISLMTTAKRLIKSG